MGVGPAETPLSPGAVRVAWAPPPRTVGGSGRSSYQQPRPRRLTPEDLDRVAPLVGSRSLRDLAADFGVSHETVRRVVLRDADKVA